MNFIHTRNFLVEKGFSFLSGVHFLSSRVKKIREKRKKVWRKKKEQDDFWNSC